jgi:spore maturation protein CgeB
VIRVAFYGSSLLSAYWNGAATYYRGLLSALAPLGYDITFYEPDAFERQLHRDIDPPDWARVHVYAATAAGVRDVLNDAKQADVVVKASGVGVFDTELLAGIVAQSRSDALRIFWDVDAPATLAEIGDDPDHPIRAALPALDMVLTYGGGQRVIQAYRHFGARLCQPIYNALDPASHFPVPADAALAADLAFLANRMPDREHRASEFFFTPAESLPMKRFVLGGNGWGDRPVSPNVRLLGHVPTNRHNAFNASALAVLNVARDSMAHVGFSPATRVFEAAGAGACLITDAWDGIETFLAPNEQVLVARDGRDVVDHIATLNVDRARRIGTAARTRILADHTYDKRAKQVDALFRTHLGQAPS